MSKAAPIKSAGPSAAAAPPSAWTQAARVQVRRPGPTFTAVRASSPDPVLLADGSTVYPQPGDWLITPHGAGQAPIAIVPADHFPAPYEIVDTQTLHLSAADRERLERTTGLASTRTAADLLAAVERLAKIQIGSIAIEFTPGQLEELARRATKRGHTIRQELELAVDRVKGEIFHTA